MTKEILCAYGVDVDAVAGWLGSYAGEDSPDDISRGMFAGEVGSLRLLKLFDRDDVVHPRPFDRDLPGSNDAGRKGRP
jgi:peptidoglycan-N-acetylglucosamine deacetylase